MSQPFDRSGKWLTRHHGDAILKLAGVGPIRSWRALQAEVVQPRQLPDGLLEVELEPDAAAGAGAAEPGPALFVVEIATYPERRLAEQATRDALALYLDRGRLPETLTLVLSPHPRWSYRVSGENELSSARGWTHLRLRWRVVELWTVPAERLLAAGDVGLLPWVPLSQIEGPAEPVLRECRRLIDAAPPGEQVNLLAVTQVLARLRYNDPGILNLFGGRRAMIESPLIQELVAETRQEEMQQAILLVVESRYGPVPQDVAAAVRAVREEPALRDLIVQAARCPDVDTFRQHLPPAARA